MIARKTQFQHTAETTQRLKIACRDLWPTSSELLLHGGELLSGNLGKIRQLGISPRFAKCMKTMDRSAPPLGTIPPHSRTSQDTPTVAEHSGFLHRLSPGWSDRFCWYPAGRGREVSAAPESKGSRRARRRRCLRPTKTRPITIRTAAALIG